MNKEEIKNIFTTIDKINSPYYEISRERMYKIKECIEDLYNQLQDKKQENQELKEQLEICYCNRTDCAGRIKDSKQYDSLVQKVENQQKEFIKYLENEKERCLTFYSRTPCMYAYDVFKDVLSKYKKIIGGKDEDI